MIRRALVSPPALPIGWRSVLLAAVVYTAVLVVVVVLRAESGTDFRDFWQTAGHFRATGEIRTDFGVHNYLPFFAIFMAPWSMLPLPIAAALFAVLSMSLFCATVRMIELLLTRCSDGGPRVSTLLAIGLALPYLHATAVLGQVNVLLLFLIVATWLLAVGGREWTAGVPLGLAILIKLLPAALVVFFLLQRRWRVVGSTAGVAMVLGIGMPLSSLGWDETVRQHAEFYRGAIVAHSAVTTLTTDKPIKAKYSNNSLPIVLRRLLSPVNGDPHEDGRTLRVNVVALPLPVILTTYALLIGAIVVISAVITTFRRPGWPLVLAGHFERGNALFALWCVLMLLASPLVWTHYFVLAFPALAVLTDRLERRWREHQRVCRAAAVALIAWLVGALLLTWPAARAAGAQMFAAVVLWIALLIVTPRRRVNRDQGEPHAPA